MASDGNDTFDEYSEHERPDEGNIGIGGTGDAVSASEAIEAFNNVGKGDEYGEEFVQLLLTLREQLPTLHMKNGGNSAAVIPKYDSKDAVPDEDFADMADNGEALVVVDGDDGPILYRCK